MHVYNIIYYYYIMYNSVPMLSSHVNLSPLIRMLPAKYCRRPLHRYIHVLACAPFILNNILEPKRSVVHLNHYSKAVWIYMRLRLNIYCKRDLIIPNIWINVYEKYKSYIKYFILYYKIYRYLVIGCRLYDKKLIIQNQSYLSETWNNVSNEYKQIVKKCIFC